MQRRRELEMLREQALRSSGLTLPNLEFLCILAIQNKDLDGLNQPQLDLNVSICRTSKCNLITNKHGQEDDNHVVYHQNGFHVCFLSHKGHSLFGNNSLHEKFCFQKKSLEKPNMSFGNINHSLFGNIHFLETFWGALVSPRHVWFIWN